jgi:hypothetical protein
LLFSLSSMKCCRMFCLTLGLLTVRLGDCCDGERP